MRNPAAAIFLLVLLIRPGCAHRNENFPGPDGAGDGGAISTAPATEFRAAWVATVANIDWPSRPGLSVEQQCSEIGQILDRAVALNLNAIIFQARPCADAMYASPYEPWSEYLTGRQGVAPAPLYDPLATWVREAHKRNIQLHAWVNPFRARHVSAKAATSPNHVSVTRPQWVRRFDKYEWLDPGDPDARAYSQEVILDILRRYDVDGIHIDDYFYPYPEYLKGADFPDDSTWRRYQEAGGKLTRGDWRRDNVNRFVRDLYLAIKRTKPAAQFGISPFGIWRPNHPPGTTGLDPYDKLYADARLWLNEGWCDYFVPQLYWTLDAKGHAYGDLLKWWVGQNKMGRRIYGGNKIFTVGTAAGEWPVGEILKQIEFTRATPGAGGNVFFSMKPLMMNRGGLGDALKAGPYVRSAVAPR